MTAETLSAIAGLVLSLAMTYVPGLSDWYAALDGVRKRLLMAGLLLTVAAGSVGFACAGLAADLGLTVTCDQVGVLAVVQAYIAALVANQATDRLARRN